jgi:hypothetical protein
VTAWLDLGGVIRMEKGLTGGARMSAREEREGATARMHKPEEKAPFGECAKHLRPTGPSGGHHGLWEAGLAWRSWARFRGRFKIEIGF